MKIIIKFLFPLNLDFLAADGIGQNRLGNNRLILNLNNNSDHPSNLLFNIMAKMKNSDAGKKVLKSYLRMVRPKKSNPSRLKLYLKNFMD